MNQKTSGKWRTLDDTEIALVKGMRANGLARDYIMSFFARPGRVISPAVVGELDSKFPDIAPASSDEVQAFISRRLSKATADAADHGFGPTSSIRVREILQLTREGQGSLPGFESLFAEFKELAPVDKAGRSRVAKCLAAFANHQGGYVFIGISDDGEIVGVPEGIDIELMWNAISDVVTRHFTPFFAWERGSVDVAGKRLAVAYAFSASDKPIIAASDFAGDICKGQIYFRYNRSSETIHPGDLIKMLHDRDRRAASGSVVGDG